MIKIKRIIIDEIIFYENYFNDLKNILTIEENTEVEKELAKFGKTIIHFFKKHWKFILQKKMKPVIWILKIFCC